MPNCFAMGEAAGTAAAILAGKGSCQTRSIDVTTLQSRLVRQGAWLGDDINERYREEG
ncbi:FAD-dependent oxidoreductase [Paenibacillus riograndensis]|nr:FAD-dependent oxidoreductase [Paenibacillus riograndensis]